MKDRKSISPTLKIRINITKLEFGNITGNVEKNDIIDVINIHDIIDTRDIIDIIKRLENIFL